MPCADQESFVRRGPTVFFVCFFYMVMIQIPLKADHHLPASILMAFRWQANDGPTLNVSLAVFFSGNPGQYC